MLTGEVVEVNLLSIVLNVGGIGYLVHMPQVTTDCEIGTTLSLYTHLAVRENALDLYGFEKKSELEMFELLLHVPKVGPKTALGIMSQADIATLRHAAISGDANELTKVSGIGKKSAEKIVAGLKDKFDANEDFEGGGSGNTDGDVIDALITLGYSQREAREVTQKLPPEITETNDRIRAALKHIGK